MLRRSLLALLLAGCGATPETPRADAAVADVSVTDAPAADVPPLPERAAGTRAPRTADCDVSDPSRCLLPWPSDVFAERDPAGATGLRLRVAPSQAVNRDDVTVLRYADGFSRATPVLTSVALEATRESLGDGERAAIRVVVTEPGEAFGTLVPVRMHLVPDPEADAPGSLLVAFPRRPFRAASEHAGVLMDDVRDATGRAPTADPRTRVSLGLAPAVTAEDRAAVAFFAPVRAAMLRAGIDLARVVRVWTFTTRSAEQPRVTLRTVRAAMTRAVDEDRARVTLSRVTVPSGSGDVAVVVEGFVEGLPNPLTAGGILRRDASGAVTFGESDFRAPFRVMIPRGEGPWPVVLWGHGTGGDVRDTSFDSVIAANRAAKVNFEFEGWTGDRVIETFAAFTKVIDGVDQSSAKLVRSIGGIAAITEALLGDADGRHAALADALAAPTLMGAPNPAAGRRPMRNRVVYAGGSLGGTLGAVITRCERRIEGAVLNVPGGGWSHYTPFANLFAVLRPALRTFYGTEADLWVFLAMSQSIWDVVDGGIWADAPDHAPPTLLQQSMGDPVLPNLGTEFLAASLRAVQLGAVLSPVTGSTTATELTTGTALTQFRVPASQRDALDVHGFAARDTPAGLAAQAQLSAFALSVQAGAPRATIPPQCQSNTPAGSCDFSAR